MQSNRTHIMLFVILSLSGVLTTVSRARPLPYAKQRATIKALVRDVDTPAERTKAVSELIRIVKDDNRDRWLRTFAAEELGQLGAVEAESTLKSVADQLGSTDTDRRLRWSAYLAQWQIRIARQPKRENKIQLLNEALTDRYDGLIAWRVQAWAGSELANMGIKEAMPDVIKSIRRREPPNRAEELIQFQQAKVDILNTYSIRLEALTFALAAPDTNTQHKIKVWAISELGKLRTEESIQTLAAYGSELQNVYYDEKGRRIRPKDDPLRRHVHRIYHTIIRTLKANKVSDSAMEQMGLHRERFSVVAP